MKPIISRSQKIAVLFAALPSITGTIYFLCYHDFSPNPALFKPSLALTALITIGAFLLFFAKFKNGSWKSEKKINGFKDKLIIYLLAPLAFYFYTPLHIYIIAPRVYTAIFGTELTVAEKVRSKNEGHGRHKICDYHLNLENHRTFALATCISRKVYFSTLDSGDIVILKNLESPAGSIIQAVSVPN